MIDHDLYVANFDSDSKGRLAVLTIRSKIEDSFKLKIVNVYAPNDISSRKAFFNKILCSFLDITSKTVMMGDFNCITKVSDSTSTTSRIYAMEGSVDLKDVCTVFNLNEGDYNESESSSKFTWHQANERTASRLDRIYKPLEWDLVYTHRYCPFSDHYLVIGTLSSHLLTPPSKNKLRSFWKINNNILQDPAFKHIITRLFSDTATLRPYFESSGAYWDHLKQRIKRVTNMSLHTGS